MFFLRRLKQMCHVEPMYAAQSREFTDTRVLKSFPKIIQLHLVYLLDYDHICEQYTFERCHFIK